MNRYSEGLNVENARGRVRCCLAALLEGKAERSQVELLWETMVGSMLGCVGPGGSEPYYQLWSQLHDNAITYLRFEHLIREWYENHPPVNTPQPR